MVKHFVFIKDFIIEDKTYYTKGTELSIKNNHGIDYVKDGCFLIFRVDSDTAKEYGEIVDRLW